MMFRESTYSVLLVSSSEKFNHAILALLPGTDYYPVTVVGNTAEARRLLTEQPFDLVIINSPLQDDAGVRLATDTCSRTNAAVLLFVRADVFEITNSKVIEHGVITLSKPTSAPMIEQALRSLCAIRERLRRIGEKHSSLEEKLEEVRLVNRAKWVLIEQGMTEDDAHRYMEKQAMDRRISKKEFAEIIIKGHE